MNDKARAKALIESGASLREIARCFSGTLDAYRFYAETSHSQFARVRAAAAPACVCCSHHSDQAPHQITWRAVAHSRGTGLAALTLLLFGQMTSGHVEVQFTTAYSYCTRCARRLSWSFSLIRAAKSVLFAVLVLALFVTVPLAVVSGAVLFAARDLLPRFSLFMAAGLLFLFLLYLCFRWLWTSAVPTHLRFIGRFPFEPLDVQRMDENAV